jgi:hypothetical protein
LASPRRKCTERTQEVIENKGMLKTAHQPKWQRLPAPPLAWHNAVVVRMILLLVLLLCPSGLLQSAQDDPGRGLDHLPRLKSEIERDRALRLGFEAVLSGDLDAARRYLPLVTGRPWLGEDGFPRRLRVGADD